MVVYYYSKLINPTINSMLASAAIGASASPDAKANDLVLSK
jgi:hypothetical protein